ncbi:MAG: histidinol-phosphatase [Ferrimicrobium sp.]
MLDYHLHLWAHGDPDRPIGLDELAAYCERAQKNGVVEIALTEHLFRFRQAEATLGRFFYRYPDSPMRELMQSYWLKHARADLDHYVEAVQSAKDAGLPVVLGLEVDYYEGEMEAVRGLLEGYPFDVLLGSIHWIHTWPFDHVADPMVQAEWERVGVEPAWESYTRALEELADSHTVDVLAHPDLVKVAGHRPAVPEEFYDRMAEAARRSQIAAEVSSAGLRKPVDELYPGPELLARFFAHGVPVTTASDAHRLEDVADRVPMIRAALSDAGYDSLVQFRNRKRTKLALL